MFHAHRGLTRQERCKAIPAESTICEALYRDRSTVLEGIKFLLADDLIRSSFIIASVAV